MDISVFEEHARKNLEEQRLPACAWRVRKDGVILSEGAVGYRDYETREPLPAVPLFRLASMTKQITCAVVLRMAEEGRLSIEDPLSRFIPGTDSFIVGRMEDGRAVPDHPAARQITIRHLLSHTAGLGGGDVGDIPGYAAKGKKLRDCVPHVSEMMLDFDPQSKNSYSWLYAFDVLAYLCELVSGQEFDELVRTRISDVLETDELFFEPTPEQEARMVNLYKETEHGLERNHSTDGVNCIVPRYFYSGSAGLVGSVDAYDRFLTCLLNEGVTPSGRRMLDAASVRMMQTPAFSDASVNRDNGEKWGLSVPIVVEPQKETAHVKAGTLFFNGAYGTHAFLTPSERLCAVYMTCQLEKEGCNRVAQTEFQHDVMDVIS